MKAFLIHDWDPSWGAMVDYTGTAARPMPPDAKEDKLYFEKPSVKGMAGNFGYWQGMSGSPGTFMSLWLGLPVDSIPDPYPDLVNPKPGKIEPMNTPVAMVTENFALKAIAVASGRVKELDLG